MAGFVHLHVHSDFSLLDGLGKVKELTQAAAPVQPGYREAEVVASEQEHSTAYNPETGAHRLPPFALFSQVGEARVSPYVWHKLGG